MTFAGWAAEDGTNQLDLALLLNNNDPAVGKTLDGKPRIMVKGGALPVRGLRSLGKATLLAYKLPSNSRRAFDANEIYRVKDVLMQGTTAVAKEMGIACDFNEPDDLSLSCDTALATIYARTLSFELAACPEASQETCVDHKGRKVQIIQRRSQPERKASGIAEAALRTAVIKVLTQSGIRAVDDQSGQPTRAALGFDTTPDAPLVLVTRGRADLAQLERQGYTLLGWLTTSDLIEQAGEIQTKQLEANQQRAAVRDQVLAAIDSTPATADVWGAVRIAAESEAICTLRDGANETTGWMRQALLRTDEFTRFRAAKEERSRPAFARQTKQANELYQALQTRRCSIIVERAGVLKLLTGAMQRDKVAFDVMPALLAEPALAEVQAVAKGFRSAAEWNLVQSLGASSQGEVERLASYGIRDRQQVDEAIGRMRSSNYAQSRDNLLPFLADEAEGRKAGQSGLAVREQRQREAARHEAQARDEQARRHPYIATLTCGMSGRHINILACFAAGSSYGASTSLEIRNGTQYGLYKVHEISRLGRETSAGFVIDLAESFTIKAQDSDDTLTLGLTITDRRTGKRLFTKQVDRYGVIRISNP